MNIYSKPVGPAFTENSSCDIGEHWAKALVEVRNGHILIWFPITKIDLFCHFTGTFCLVANLDKISGMPPNFLCSYKSISFSIGENFRPDVCKEMQFPACLTQEAGNEAEAHAVQIQRARNQSR